MNGPTDTPEAKFTDAVGPHLIENARYHVNLEQEVIIITGDKLELCLRKHIGCVAARGQWITPASLFITFIATMSASTFHDALGMKANVWEAIFVILACASGIWLAISIVHIFRFRTSLEALVKEIKKISDVLSNQQNQTHAKPAIPKIHNSASSI